MGLVITFILGFFIIIGALITFLSKNNKSFINFSIGLAFSVITLLVLLELIPHTLETLNSVNSIRNSIIVLMMFSISGILMLKILDSFIPHHHGNHKHNLEHIGLLTSVAIILHNVIEGMAIYNICEMSLSAGLLISVGVGLHNIPLGMIVASTLYQGNKDKKQTTYIITLIALSTFLGGLLMLVLNDYFSVQIQGIILSITLGMLIYISIFELMPKILKIKNKRDITKGMLLGVVFIILALLFHHH